MRLMQILSRADPYRLGVLLSSGSLGLGLLREFMLFALLGISSKNDLLQLYLSVIFTISLMIDAVRLACLNVCTEMTLRSIVLCASCISLPICMLIGAMMYVSAGTMNPYVAMISIAGGYSHLIACLLITYRQRYGRFLAAQVINVMPNAVLIPGIVLLWIFSKESMIVSVVVMTSVIPMIQCIFLLILKTDSNEIPKHNTRSIASCGLVFIRHFSTTAGEQLFQIIIRSTFFKFGPGYLSIFSLAVRAVSALRFILIDSYIGSKLSVWKNQEKSHSNVGDNDNFLSKHRNTIGVAVVLLSLLLCMHSFYEMTSNLVVMGTILAIGFYFSTWVRILYFKINHHGSHPLLVVKFAAWEFAVSMIALALSSWMQQPLWALLWLGYIAKPFSQLGMLNRTLHSLHAAWEK